VALNVTFKSELSFFAVMAFHFSRWKFWYGYLFVILSVLGAVWFYYKGGSVPALILVGFGLFLLVLLEFFIRAERLVIEDSTVILYKGIFSRNVMRISYNTISNVSVNQTFLERIFGVGDIFIDTPGGPSAEIVLKKFHSPVKIEKMIDERINKAYAGLKPVAKK
jgi:uncharacterized membrane protein YdbT with pleckstrin-like domain